MTTPKVDLSVATIETRMIYFESAFRELLREVGANGMVGIIGFEGVSVALRIPGCPTDCPDEAGCTATIFREAANDLLARAEEVAAGVHRNLRGGGQFDA